jgi:hypothetical protein
MMASFLFFLGMPGARVNTLVFLLDPRRAEPKPSKPAK